MDGTAPLRVVDQGRSSAAVEMHLGLEVPTLSLEQPAHVGGPVWVHIQLPAFPHYGNMQYPLGLAPADFGCHQVEVRRNGTLLPRIPTPAPSMPGGLVCGNIGIPGHEIQVACRCICNIASTHPACTKCGTRAVGGARNARLGAAFSNGLDPH
jgi:hypothetical protein